MNDRFQILPTDPASTARVDYLVYDIDNEMIVAGIEFKVRVSGITLTQLRNGRKDIMIEESKLTNLECVSRLLAIPTYIWNFFLEDRVLVSHQVTDENGNLITPYRVFPLEAQRNTNNNDDKRTKVFAAFHGRHRRELLDEVEIPDGCTKLSLDELQSPSRN